MHDYERFAHYDVDYQACDEEFARRIERREQKLNDAWEYGRGNSLSQRRQEAHGRIR